MKNFMTDNEKLDTLSNLLKANMITLERMHSLVKDMKKKPMGYDVFVIYKGGAEDVAPTFKATSCEEAVAKTAAKIEKIIKKRRKESKKFEIFVGTSFSEEAFKKMTKRRRAKRAGKKG